MANENKVPGFVFSEQIEISPRKEKRKNKPGIFFSTHNIAFCSVTKKILRRFSDKNLIGIFPAFSRR